MFGATIRELVFAGAGYVAGAFTPSIGRKIKAFFTKEESALAARVTALEKKVVVDGETAIKKTV